MRDVCCVLREGDERFQSFADDIRMRESGFVRQDLPGGIEERLRGGGCVKRET